MLAAVVVTVVVVLVRMNNKVHALAVDTAVVMAALLAAWQVLIPANSGSGEDNTQVDLDSAARDLLIKVSTDEFNQRARLLNFAFQPAHPRLIAARSFYSYHERAQPQSCRWQDTFKTFWRSESRRLILLGPPGAGKTLLLMDLAMQSADFLGEHRPILVRVNIAQWRTKQTFYDFFIHKVSSERGLPAEIVSTLLRRQRIIPLLDGLDELDAENSDHPDRGLEIISRLNAATPDEYPINAPIIVTCRTDYFEKLEQSQQQIGHEVIGLAGAGILKLESLKADQISNFLDSNLGADAQTRWTAVLNALRSSQPHVVGILGLPWRLALAFSAYQHRGRPDILLGGEEAGAAEAELLPQFLRMAIRAQNFNRQGANNSSKLQRQWFGHVARDPSRVAHWLKEIAGYLEMDRAVGGGAGELLMYEIHKMVNRKLMRFIYGVCALGVVAVTGVVISVTALSGPHPFPRIVAISAAVIFLASAAYVAILRPPSTPAGSTLRQFVQTPQSLLDSTLSLLSALAASVFALGTQNAPLPRVVGGLCCGFMAGLFFGFVHAKRLRARGAGLQYSETPTDPLRGGLANSSIIGGIIGIIYTVALLASGSGLTMSILFGILTLIAFAPTFGLPIASIAWTRYKVALLILYLEHRLPWRLTTFLQWNYEVGLMRTAGLAYQFRHLRMQTWLAQIDETELLSPLMISATDALGKPNSAEQKE
ncbi:MAG TPA: NACHT domain-containing protein [Acidobacteriaceae bacterium]|nr:NACHT domain-containing protein [Acidobacteriaceae bacterium]